ncbi:MAG: hypothetical protein ACK4NR_05195 [Micavibrio sp.]
MKTLLSVCSLLMIALTTPVWAEDTTATIQTTETFAEAPAAEASTLPEDLSPTDEEWPEEEEFSNTTSAHYSAFGDYEEEEIDPSIDPARVEWAGSPQNPE